jgi:hypothetical protein
VITVTEVRQTCGSCPSQWEGRTDDGRHVYVRYRWGWLQVGLGATLDDAVSDETIGFQHGDEYDGSLTYDELQGLTVGRVQWPLSEGQKTSGEEL